MNSQEPTTNRPNLCPPFAIEFTTNSHLHQAGELKNIEGSEAKIGRGEECDILFGEDCDTVSRLHAVITCQNGRYILRNESKTNVTLVNGKPVKNTYNLSHRDSLQFSENGPKVLFLAPGATGSSFGSFEDEHQAGQTRKPGDSAQYFNTQKSGASYESKSSSGCLPFTIEYGKPSSLRHAGQMQAVSDSKALIGRASHSQIKFGNDCLEVSNEHAEIVCKNGQWMLVHLSKTNKTFVNGQLVSGELPLNHGDEIQLASPTGQSIRFFQSGHTGQEYEYATGKVNENWASQQPNQPLVSRRSFERLNQSNQIQKWILAGLGVLIVAAGSFLVYLNKKIQTPPLPVTIIENPADPKNFPMTDYYKYVFFADGQFKIKFGKINHTQPISGSGFLDNKGHLITAHHVIKPTHYPESALEAEIQLNEASFTPLTNYKFFSPKAIETCYNSDLNWGFASPDPDYPLSEDLYDNLKKFSNILIGNEALPVKKSQFMQYRSCALAEDWAVAKPSALKKLSETSPIVIDRDYARNLTEHTPLVSLGYRNGLSETPQLKYMELAVIKKGKNSDFPLFLVVNPDFGSGDSGSPVFAYKKEGDGKGKWVVVGIVIAKSFYSEFDSWGIILPAYCITENHLD